VRTDIIKGKTNRVREAAELDEFARIRHWTAGRQQVDWQRERGVVVGIGDDAAVVAKGALVPADGAGLHWVFAVDTMVETVHFNGATMRDYDVGYKALAANVSDIAAMGAVPAHALVSVSVPPAYGAERMRGLYDGLYACADRYGIAVIGGDTTSSPEHLVVSVTLTGTVEAGKALTRSGAMPGDAVFVTGPTGMSAAGLQWLTSAAAADGPVPEALAEAEGTAALVRAHRRPEPSVQAGRLLAGCGSCTSLNDVSDGAASEAWEIAEASGRSIVLREEWLPRSGSMAAYAGRLRASAGGDAARQLALDWMLYGGEDYVLLGTAAGSDAEPLRAAFREAGIPLYVIGHVEDGEPGVWLEKAAGGGRLALDKRGYNHFQPKTDRKNG
jgi:thiamine-monophosphate kinase